MSVIAASFPRIISQRLRIDPNLFQDCHAKTRYQALFINITEHHSNYIHAEAYPELLWGCGRVRLRC